MRDFLYRRCSFFWVVNVFKDLSLYILAVIMRVIAILSPWPAPKKSVANSVITGIVSGMSLFCFAILGLIRYPLAKSLLLEL